MPAPSIIPRLPSSRLSAPRRDYHFPRSQVFSTRPVSFCRPFSARLRRGPDAVPSEDYSRWPPCFAVFWSKGRQNETNGGAQKKDHENYRKTEKQQTGLLSRSEQLGTENRPEIDFDLRRANRALETEKLLALLRSDAPRFFEIAEVVGKWVWIQFSDKQPSTITTRSGRAWLSLE